jgi:hypothetical protein
MYLHLFFPSICSSQNGEIIVVPNDAGNGDGGEHAREDLHEAQSCFPSNSPLFNSEHMSLVFKYFNEDLAQFCEMLLSTFHTVLWRVLFGQFSIV